MVMNTKFPLGCQEVEGFYLYIKTAVRFHEAYLQRISPHLPEVLYDY